MIQDVKSTNSSEDASPSQAEPPEAQAGAHFYTVSLQVLFFIFALSALLNGICFWQEGHTLFPTLSARSLSVIFASLFIVAAYQWHTKVLTPSTTAAGIGLLVLFASQWLQLRYGLFQSPVIRGEILLFSLLSLGWLIRKKPLPLTALLFLASTSLIYMLATTADGRLIFSDDNPTFLYRLMLLKENFPDIPFYNPLWNTGIDQRDFFATGTLNFFLLFSPLLYIFPVPQLYNWLVSGLLFILTPALIAFACSLAGFKRRACLIAALLALAPSLLWFRWALQYGTLGFITATALIPLNLVLASRAIGRESKFSLAHSLLLVMSTTLMLFWSPSGLVFIPAIVLTLLLIKRVYKRKLLLLTAILLLCINLPWIGLFWKVSKVSSFLDSEKQAVVESETQQVTKAPRKKDFKEKTQSFSLERTLEKYREIATSANPLILLFFIPGIFLLGRDYRLVFGATTIWLLFLGGAASAIKPQLELDRMLVILLMVLTIPVAAAIDHLLTRSEAKSRWRPVRILTSAIVLGFLCSGVYATGSILRGRSIIPLAFSSRLVPELTNAVQTHAGNGRILFSGFVLHDFSGGHIAPLALLSNRPLIASSPVHNLWSYQQVFPEDFIQRKDKGIQEYLNLHNVSTVVAHEKFWREYFETRTDRFHKVWSYENFTMFERLNAPDSYFLEGDGALLEQTSHSIRLSLKSDEAIISFNYFPFLSSEHCKLSPHRITNDIHFIKVSECTQKQAIVIHSVNPIKRYMLTP